jgi:IclR family pca regulon transcriptional regulator
MGEDQDAAQQSAEYRAPALQRGLSILQMFSARQRSLSSHTIAERLGVSGSAIYRILVTLTEMGYLNKRGSNSYELGPQVLCDGFAYLASRDLVDIAMPQLNALRDRSSLSCHLGIRDQTEVVYQYRAFATQRLSVNVPIGTRLPCHVTALGRVLLSELDEDSLAKLYQHARLDGYPAPAPKTLPELLRMSAQDRARGFVLHRSDYSTAIATAIRDHSGRIVAAINLSGPDAVMDDDRTQQSMRQALLACAAQISRNAGYREQ